MNYWFVGFCNTPAERLLRTGICGQQTVVFSKAEILGWLELVAVEKSEQTGQKKQENMNAIVEGLACFLGFLSWLMVGLALRNRHWRDSTFDGNLIMSSSVYENLWISCATDSTGVHNCRDFPSMFELNGTFPLPIRTPENLHLFYLYLLYLIRLTPIHSLNNIGFMSLRHRKQDFTRITNDSVGERCVKVSEKDKAVNAGMWLVCADL